MLEIEVLESKLCQLIKLSLENKQHSEEITFPLPQKAIEKAKKKIYINLSDYTCLIHSDEIRHIHKEHGDEVYHICKIHYYLEKFAKIERSSTRDRITGKNIPCLVFTKKQTTKDIRMVKMNLSRKKILRLKTMFEV
jgi:hypothetical protein